MPQLATYSGGSVSCSLVSGPEGLFSPIQFGGVSQTGLESISIRMTVDHANLQFAMEGTAVPSWTPGEGGEIDISVYQTSSTHIALVNAYNAILAAVNNGDVTQTFTNTLIITEVNTGGTRTCTGVAFPKIPDQPFQKEAQPVHWVFRACQINTEYQHI